MRVNLGDMVIVRTTGGDGGGGGTGDGFVFDLC